MTLPSSGTITMGNVKTELGISGTLTLTDSRVRTLFGVPSGTITLLQGLGKSNITYPVYASSYTGASGWSNTSYLTDHDVNTSAYTSAAAYNTSTAMLTVSYTHLRAHET